MAMKLELIAKEVIKPASPTPHHLRTLQLSIFDQFMPRMYGCATFFYDKDDQTTSEEFVSQRLKNSLSETLTRFYPLAGRIEGVSVNCNDEGVMFTEARANVLLSDFLRNPDVDLLKQLLTDPVGSSDPGVWPLLHVKVSFFKTRGVAVAVNVSHKVFDAWSITRFVRHWAAIAQQYADAVNSEFIGSAFYPPADISVGVASFEQLGNKLTTKRFVFLPSRIKELKTRAASERVPDPTRVEATTALLYNAMKSPRPNGPFAMTQLINLRTRVSSTLLSPRAVGNLFYSPFLKEGSEAETNITEMVNKLRKTKEELYEMIRENPQGTRSAAELGERIASEMLTSLCELRPDMDKYIMSSLCRMPFYEVDFGWGSPVWVSLYSNDMPRICRLMDTKDGEGIEAWVTLPEEDMPAFEHDQDLLAFATPNPSVPTTHHRSNM